jgi:hypothetical protein
MPAGDRLFLQGDYAGELHFIELGRLRIERKLVLLQEDTAVTAVVADMALVV